MSDTSAAPIVEVRGLGHAFDGRPALRQIDFVLAPGTVVALVGPNGSGKTTLLRILAGLLRPSEGAASVGGHDVTRDGAAARGMVGYVADHSLAYPGLTVRENLVFFAALYGVADARLEPCLRATGLWPLRNARVATLSRGQVQRLALCRAILHEPAALLLDEPHSGLDARAAAELDQMLVNLVAEGRTVLLATHDLARVRELAQRALVLRGGRLVWDGPPDGLAQGTAAGAVVDGVPAQPVASGGPAGSQPADSHLGCSSPAGSPLAGSSLAAAHPSSSLPGRLPRQPQLKAVVAAVSRKDLLLEWRSRESVPPAVVFALLVLVLFHYAVPFELLSGLAHGAGAARIEAVASAVPGVLWVAFLFGSTLGFGRALTTEGGPAGLSILAMTPADRGYLFLAKWLVGYLLGLLLALALVPAAAVLLGLPGGVAGRLLAVMAVGLVGWSAAGTLLVGLTAHSRARHVLLPILLFPAVLPLVIAGVQASLLLAAGDIAAALAPLALTLAMDALYLVLGSVLFPLAMEMSP